MVIAGALALEPSMLVADEPVSAWTPVRGEILALLLGLVRDLGLSILVVTRDLGLAWNIADRLAVMYLGHIVEQGPTEAVLANPATLHPGTAVGRPRGPPSGDPDPLRWAPDPTRVPGGAAGSTPAARHWPPARPPGRASTTAAAPSPCPSCGGGRASRRLLPD